MYRKVFLGILSICLGCFWAFGLDFTGVHGDSGDYSETKSFSILSDNDISGTTTNGWIFETGTVSGNSGASTITIKGVPGTPRSSSIQTYTTPGRRFNYLNFTLRVSGKLSKSGPEPGTMPNYLLTGNRSGEFAISAFVGTVLQDTAVVTVPQGTSVFFTAIEHLTGQTSPTAPKLCDWAISPTAYTTLGVSTSVSGLIDRTYVIVGSSEWPHPDAGSYVISAVLSSSSERNVKSAALNIVGVQKVEATYGETTVTSTTASPGDAQTIYIPVGESVTITATPTPTATWPSGYPTWKVNGTSAGTAGSATYALSSSAAGTYTVSAICGTSTKAIKIVVVEIDSITVESGATQTNVTGSDNWAAVKNADEDAIVKITLSPDIAESLIPSDLISWTGGEAISGQSLHRKVTKATPVKHTIVASCGDSTADLNVWVMWATVTMQKTGEIPADVPLEFPVGGKTCGEITTPNNSAGYGNIFGTVTLLPAGVGSVVTTGWDIKRERMELHIVDGEEKHRDQSWEDDDAGDDDEVQTPANDKLYVIDSPNIGHFPEYADADIIMRYMNFYEWLEWNGEMCSAKVDWAYQGIWFLGSGVHSQNLSLSYIDFPTPQAARMLLNRLRSIQQENSEVKK